MSGRVIDDLIEQLELLRVHESRIIQKIVDERARETRSTDTASNNHSGVAEPRTRSFRIGDRVSITNAVRKPFGRKTDRGDREGVVTKITAQRVFLKTDNGSTTNRVAHNLKLVRDD